MFDGIFNSVQEVKEIGQSQSIILNNPQKATCSLEFLNCQIKTFRYPNRLPNEFKIICILRVRNEELILNDTLEHLSQFCDGIVAFDDASVDNTFCILKSHEKVIAIIKNMVINLTK